MTPAAATGPLDELDRLWRDSGALMDDQSVLLCLQVTVLAALAYRDSEPVPVSSRSDTTAPVSWAHLNAISPPNFSAQLTSAFTSLAKASPDTAKLFDTAPLRQQPNERALGLLLQWALRVAQRTDVPLILDGLIARLGQGSRDPVTLPTTVASLLVGLLDLRDGQEIADPFCRTGDLLQAVAGVAKHDGHTGSSFTGYEVSPFLAQIARLRALWRDLPDRDIECRDALFLPPEAGGRLRQFDRIVTSPPITLRLDISELEKDRYLRFPLGVQPRTGADIARIEHIIASLKAGGRAVVLVPAGLLFRSGHEQRVREELLSRDVIDTIIALPPGAYYGTRIATAVLVLVKGRPANRRGRIRYVNAAHLGDARRSGPPDEDLIDRILLAAKSDASEEGFVHEISLADTEANQWNLAPLPYFRAAPEELADPAELTLLLKERVAEQTAAQARFDAAAADLAALLGGAR